MVDTVRRTTCSRDCPDACGILATVRDGVVQSLAGDPEHPVTRGFLCFRTSRFVATQNSPERVTQPLLRKGGELVPVSMGEALDYAAKQLQRIRAESGPAAIFHYRSGGSLGLLKLVADRFFEHFGPCATKIGDICSGAGEAAQELDLGVADSNALFDLRHSKHIYLWGKNPKVSSVHLVPLLKECRARGARVTLIDPVRHASVSLADRYIAPRPGGDAALACGIGRALVERGGIDPAGAAACENFPAWRELVMSRSLEEWAATADLPAATIDALAADFAEGPTAILVGWGMQRRSNGAAIVRSLDALSAVSGNLFRPGGGCSFYFRRRAAFASEAVARGVEMAPRVIREPQLAEDVLAAKDPPIRAIWVTAGNPVAMLPDAAAVARVFEQTEFTVVVDPLLTDTGRRASLVLPVPTLLEDSDLLGAYGHDWLAESQPVVPPPPGVLHEVELLAALAERVGLGAELAGTVDDYKRRLLRDVEGHGVSLPRLRRGVIRNPQRREQLFEDHRVATPTGRVQLIDELPSAADPVGGANGEYPLWLFSNSTEKSQASQWAGRGLETHTWVLVHPGAVPVGACEGDVIEVASEAGALHAKLRLDADLRPDVAVMPKGGHFDSGHAANVLIRARATDLGLGAAYLDCRVRLRRLDQASPA